MDEKQCIECQAPLKKLLELDEDWGDECLMCVIGKLQSRIRKLESFLVLESPCG